MSVIHTENLTKSYGSVKALTGLDLSVEQGTIYGFLGPNGAGKTTTIRILTSLAKADYGDAHVGGLNVQTDRLALSKRIGFLPEEPAFYAWMTASEYLDYVGQIFNIKHAQRKNRVKEVLEQVGLSKVRNRRVGGFSRGMRQRLGLGQALINHPEILFLDEPVSALDPIGRKEILDLIEQLRGECSVFMSTHILADVERVCDTVGIIVDGKMIVEANREELITRYAQPAFELEWDPGCSEEEILSWITYIKALPGITTVQVRGQIARIGVEDVNQSKANFLSSVIGKGPVITRYQIVKPSLEDIFLSLVNNSGANV